MSNRESPQTDLQNHNVTTRTKIRFLLHQTRSSQKFRRSEITDDSRLTEQKISNIQSGTEDPSRPEIRTEEEESRMPSRSSWSWDPADLSSLEGRYQRWRLVAVEQRTTRLRTMVAAAADETTTFRRRPT